MTPDTYRKAYEKAIEDITQISETFERLSTRKKQVETLVLALQPILNPSEIPADETPIHTALQSPEAGQEAPSDVLETAENFTFLDVPVPLPVESDGDPFQRRVKSNFRLKGLAVQHSR
jgi:hypothetical protein